MTLHDVETSTLDGTLVDLSVLRGRAVLLVVLGGGPRTDEQLAGLQALHVAVRGRGGTVYGVPTELFGPLGGGAALERRLSVEHGTTFPVSGVMALSGPDASPLAALVRGDGEGPPTEVAKVLFDVDGRPLQRWDGAVPPDEPGLVAAVEAALPPVPDLRPRRQRR